MSKNITLRFEDSEYTLEFTRKTVHDMESVGFNVDDIDTKPETCITKLYEGAFLAHHRTVNKDIIWRMYESIPKKQEFISALYEMYCTTLNTLFDEPEENEGNATWGVNP